MSTSDNLIPSNQVEWLAYAREDLLNGIYSIPVQFKEKRPIAKGWQSPNEDYASIPSDHFPLNRGRLLGIPPPAGLTGGWVVCVDLDSLISKIIAPTLLPPTGETGVRGEGLPGHYYYRCSAAPKSMKFISSGKVSYAELLSTGSQVVVAPSVHPSNEIYRLVKEETRASVDANELVLSVTTLAVLSLLASVSQTWEDWHDIWHQALEVHGKIPRESFPSKLDFETLFAQLPCDSDKKASFTSKEKAPALKQACAWLGRLLPPKYMHINAQPTQTGTRE